MVLEGTDDQRGGLTERDKRERKEELIQAGIRIKVSSVGKRKVGEIGEKQILLVDVKINCFRRHIILSPGEVPTGVSFGQMSPTGREKACLTPAFAGLAPAVGLAQARQK